MRDTYQQIIDTLSRAKRVLITTHVRPDGDALGTTAAVSLGLRARGIASEVILLSHLPSKYAFIYRDYGIIHHDAEKGWPTSLDLKSFDALLVCDTGTWNQLPGLQARVSGWDVPKLVLDHHLTQEDWADVKLVVKDAAAAGEIAAELLEQWQIALDKPIATALFLAIVSDTGWFQYSSTRPYTHRLAARLIEAGVDTDRLYQLLYQNERAQRIALQARGMQSLQLQKDNRIALMRIEQKDFTETGAGVPDTENLVNLPLQIATVEVSAIFTHPPEGGPIRVSLRSKGQLDCAKFAEQFNGGGHARAAGIKIAGTMEEAMSVVSKALVDSLK